MMKMIPFSRPNLKGLSGISTATILVAIARAKPVISGSIRRKLDWTAHRTATFASFDAISIYSLFRVSGRKYDSILNSFRY